MGALAKLLGTETADLAQARSVLGGPREPPIGYNVELSVEILQKSLDRVLEAKGRLDTKAALVVPAIGAVGGLAIDRVPAQLPPVAIVVGLVAVVLSALAVGYAVACLWAGGHLIGPNPVTTASKTSESDPLKYEQGVANELALAVLDSTTVVNTKGNRLNRSLAFAAASVVALLGFVAGGGWA